MEYRKASVEDLEKIWNKNILNHLDDERWKKWKEEYISGNALGYCATFVAVDNDEPIGEITLILSNKMEAVKGKNFLCDNKEIANFNAFRIEKSYEGQGHISNLVRLAEVYAKEMGIKTLTIGVDAKETRNLAIYIHFGFNQLLSFEVDKQDNELVLYYQKDLNLSEKMQKNNKNRKKNTKLSSNSKYFDFYDDIKSGCHKVVDW